MLTDSQRKRFRALQNGEDNGTLSPAEQVELQTFVQLIEEKEAVYLRPATERIRQERLQSEAQNQELQELLRREERLQRRLERFLALSAAEREKINARVAAILNANATGTAK